MRAVTLRRVSSHKQVDNTSPEDQFRLGKAFIADQGWTHVGDYYDPAISGADESRPELNRLMADARADRIDKVVVLDLDRLARDLRVQLNILHELSTYDVQVVAVRTPTLSELERDIRGVIAAEERRKIRQRTILSRRAAAERGWWIGGSPPFGLRIVPLAADSKHCTLAINEAEAQVIRQAADLVIDQGLGTFQTTDRLNALGARPRKAARWSHQNLRQVLRSPYLRGEWELRLGGHAVRYDLPAILPDQRWAALQRALDLAPGVGNREAKRIHPLSGRIIGRCGETFHGIAASARSPVYRCKGRRPELGQDQCDCRYINAERIEQFVWDWVYGLVTTPGRLADLAERMTSNPIRDGGDQAHTLDARVARLERALEGALADGLMEGLDPKALRGATAKLQAELDAARRSQRDLRQWEETSDLRRLQVEKLPDLAKMVKRSLANPSLETMRSVFQDLDIWVEVLVHRSGVMPSMLRMQGVVVVERLVGDTQDALGTWPSARVTPLVLPFRVELRVAA